MVKLFSLSKALKMANLSLREYAGDPKEIQIRNVQVDSRKVTPGSLFVALKGEQTDGHRFLDDAARRGAVAALVNRSSVESSDLQGQAVSKTLPLLVHEDSLKGLQELAASWIKQFPHVIRIGVTGSNGKTTTKELLSSILAELAPTIKNEGNLNSEIGLPLAAFGTRFKHRFGVFEMGVNHPGEMDQMVSVLKPDYALITNVGTAHIGLLGSREGIAQEKGRLFSSLPADGIGFIPEDFEWREYYTTVCRAPLVPYGSAKTGGVEKVEGLHLAGWKIVYEGEEVRFPLPGAHNLQNALAAIQVARTLGASPEQVKRGLEKIVAIDGRSQVFEGSLRIVHDSYNANTDSVKAMLKTLKDGVELDRLVVVLGAMKELGEATEQEHRAVGAVLAELGARGIFLFGEEMTYAGEELKRRGRNENIWYSTEYEELKNFLCDFVQPGDTVLLKGSRSMELERLIPTLQNLFSEKMGK